MSAIKVTFLGTGTSQGIPVIGSDHPVCQSDDPRDRRLRVSIAIEWEQHRIVVDCGPDFRYQMLRSGITTLDAIVFTHDHADHTAGLDDVRPFYFKQGDVATYMEKEVHTALQQRFAYIFADDKYPGVPTLEVNEIDLDAFELNCLKIQPIRILHGKLPILGFVFEYKGKRFAYCTDTKTIPTASIKHLQDLDVLILSALYHKEHHSHANLTEAMDYVDQLKPRHAYFTHISHFMGFHAEIDESLPDHVNLAYDTLTIEI